MPTTVKFLTPADLRDTLRGMAAVSALRASYPDHEFRAVANGAVARWGDFAGNTCHFLFHSTGAIALGFDHESPMSPHATCTGPGDFRAWPGVYDSLPAPLADALHMNPFGPTFDGREVTFCLWNQTPTKSWQKGDIEYPEREYGDPDGEGYILGWLARYANDFTDTFREAYRWELDEPAVAELLSGDEITRECIQRLGGTRTPDEAAADLTAMGFQIV